jgi:hypothetical protein
MIPAMAMMPSRIKITMAVAGRMKQDGMPEFAFACALNDERENRASHQLLLTLGMAVSMSRPPEGGLDYMKEDSVTVGRAGRLSVHTLSERALGMRETECPPSCMHRAYRPRRVVP